MGKISKICIIILGIAMACMGIFCIFTPGATYLELGYVIGLSMIIDGIGRCVEWWQSRKTGDASGLSLATAIISLLFGIILIGNNFMQIAVDVFIAYLAAIWVLILGIIRVCYALKARKVHKEFDTLLLGKHWGVALTYGIILIILGCICIANPSIAMFSIGIGIGISILVTGTNLITLGVSIPAK